MRRTLCLLLALALLAAVLPGCSRRIDNLSLIHI